MVHLPATLRRPARHVLRRSTVNIVWAPPSVEETPRLQGYTLVRIGIRSSAADRARVEEAMRLAGEPRGLSDARLAMGDELFGWQCAGHIVSFSWIAHRDRSVGPVRLADAPGRVFLYNASTLHEHRGRGLFTHLLLAMRAALGCDGATSLVADVNVRNAPSVRGLEKAGFVVTGQVSFVTLLNRWRWPLDRIDSSSAAGPLFHHLGSRAWRQRQPADA